MTHGIVRLAVLAAFAGTVCGCATLRAMLPTDDSQPDRRAPAVAKTQPDASAPQAAAPPNPAPPSTPTAATQPATVAQAPPDTASPPVPVIAPRSRPPVDPRQLLPSAATPGSEDYRIGVDDELEISVYGDPDLMKVQTVRPGGKISFPLVGDVQAAGLTPDALRRGLVTEISRYVRDPKVTVIVTKYNSRRVSVLGEVKTPGLLRLSSDIGLLEAISRAGGITEEADLLGALLVRRGEVMGVNFHRLLKEGDASQDIVLEPNDAILIPNIRDKKVFVLGQVQKPLVVALLPGTTVVEAVSRAGGLTEDADLPGAVLVREGQPQPVNFERLFREADSTQNVLLRPNDLVLIPSIRDKKAFVLGEVARPVVVGLRSGTTVVEAISMAGGFTKDAQPKGVLLIRGGLGDPKSITVNVRDIVDGQVAQNVVLQPNDIVYVPKSFIANVTKVFQDIATILTPIILAESGIVLVPGVSSVLRTGKTDTTQPVVISP